MRAAAARNKQAARAAEAGGLAEFFGVPAEPAQPSSGGRAGGEEAAGAGGRAPGPSAEPSGRQAGLAAGGGMGGVPAGDFDRRRIYEEQRAAAARNRAAALASEAGPSSADVAGAGRAAALGAAAGGGRHAQAGPEAGEEGGDGGWEWRRQRLDVDRQRREAELLQFQQQHWREMRAAAERNRQQVGGWVVGRGGPGVECNRVAGVAVGGGL